MRRRRFLGAIGGAGASMLPFGARAQTIRPIRIGVLGDRSGIGKTASGPPTLEAARMAATDVGRMSDGRWIEVHSTEFQLRPDDAVRIARQWFDTDGVDAIVDVPTAAAAAAVQELARQRNRTFMATSTFNAALTGKACTRTASHWADDSLTLTNAIARAVTAMGPRTWFMIGPDTTISQSLQYDATKAIEAMGGRVIGLARYPAGAEDMASAIAQAKASGAAAVGLCDFGDGLRAVLRQGRALGLFDDGRQIAAYLVAIGDIHDVGLDVAQGLLIANSFYWDMNDQTRAFAQRIMNATGSMPGKPQAATYAAIRHFARAAIAAETMDAEALNLEMRRAPVYFFGRVGRVRLDGRMTLDMTVYRVKPPAKSRDPWDCYEPAANIPVALAYRSINQGGCSAVP